MGRWEVLPNKFSWKHAYMSCHTCTEPALPWGPVSMPEAGWESVETLRRVRRSRSSWCVSALSTCQKEGAPLAVALALCSPWLEDLWEREWQCHFCLWVYTVTPGHSGLIDFTLGNLKPYHPASTGRPSLWQVIFSPLQIPCPTEKSPRFLFQKTFKLDSVLQRASCGQNPSETETPETFWQRRRRIISPRQFGGFRCYSFHLSWILPQ